MYEGSSSQAIQYDVGRVEMPLFHAILFALVSESYLLMGHMMRGRNTYSNDVIACGGYLFGVNSNTRLGSSFLPAGAQSGTITVYSESDTRPFLHLTHHSHILAYL